MWSGVYRVAWRVATLQSELAVVLLAAALVLPDLFTSLVVRQVQHLVSTPQLLHLQGDRSQVRHVRPVREVSGHDLSSETIICCAAVGVLLNRTRLTASSLDAKLS